MPSYPATRPGVRDVRAPGFGRVATSSMPPPDSDHFNTIAESHERCGAMGISPIRAPDHVPRRDDTRHRRAPGDVEQRDGL